MTDTITPEQALKNLIRGYGNLLETGRDRIIAAGGDCDPVDKMEACDTYLREARAALAQQAEPAEQVQAEANVWAPDFEHLANEWADAATNGPTILDLVREGVYTFEKAKEMMEADFAHCREVSAAVRALAKEIK